MNKIYVFCKQILQILITLFLVGARRLVIGLTNKIDKISEVCYINSIMKKTILLSTILLICNPYLHSAEPYGLDAMSQFERLPYLRLDTFAAGDSSYDRSGENADSSNWLYTENNERVILDLKGPGVLYRMWFTGFKSDATIKIYLDGDTTPVKDTLLNNVFTGNTPPFLSPLVASDTVSPGGFCSYLPIPFNKSIKIKTNGSPNFNWLSFYYNFGYQLFPAGTPVTTWTGNEDSSSVRTIWNNVGSDPKNDTGNIPATGTTSIPANGTQTLLDTAGPRSISSIRIKIPNLTKDILNNLYLKIYWDNEIEPSVNAPLGTFFALGTCPTLNFEPYPTRSLPLGKDANEYMYCYFPMPFESNAKIELVSQYSFAVNNVSYEIKHKPFIDDFSKVGYFKTQSKYGSNVSGCSNDRDFVFLDVEGSGHMVGVVQTFKVTSLTTTPFDRNSFLEYLEGDERIYVDVSSSPVIQGTGTEDFYNAGFYYSDGGTGDGTKFTLPTHGMTAWQKYPNVANSQYRFFISDLIPFRKHIRFGMQCGSCSKGGQEWTLVYYYHKPDVKMVLTDTVDIGNLASEANHGYVITNQTALSTITSAYSGDFDKVNITDSGRSHKGYSQFNVVINPTNSGVILHRTLDYGTTNQTADIYVDNGKVGTWYIAGSNDNIDNKTRNNTKKWRDSDFLIPLSSYINGKSQIQVKIQWVQDPVFPNSAWTEYKYQVYSLNFSQSQPPPDTIPPTDINTLASGVATSNSVVLNWTSVGDDGNIGTASVYDIRYANVNITDSNWATATQCSGEPTPLVAGNNQSYTVNGLSAGITYYFAMKVRDEVPTNWSGLSNVVSKATNAPDTTPPIDINTLAAGNVTSNSIALSWTSVGDDGNTGTASEYDIRYSAISIDSSNWDSATQCNNEPIPQIAGTNQTYTVQGLNASTIYYFAMKVRDEVPNWSGISNIANKATSAAINIISNPGFESGTSSWIYYDGGGGSFSTTSPGYTGTNAAKCTIIAANGNIQLSQVGIVLEPNTHYRLTFSAYSTTGHDVMVNLVQNVSPYTNYGLSYISNLGTTWQTFITEFNTTGFTSEVSDGRLQFWLAPYATAGDIYYIDDVRLEIVPASDTVPPIISITSPANSTTVAVSLLTVSGAASDNVGLSKVDLKLEAGGTYTTVSGLETWSGSVTLVANGSNTVYARATDTSGNEKETTITVTYNPPDTIAPSDITTLTSGVATSNSIALNWTTVGDDGIIGTASEYDIRYATFNITSSNWDFVSVTKCSNEPAPQPSRTIQSWTVQSLSAGITYYFAMKVGDEVPNWSGISNVVSKATTAPDTTEPSTINTLATGVATSNSVVLNWTSVGDDGNIGTASVYDIRYATYSITSNNWDWVSVTQCSGVPTPLVSGNNQSYTVQGLSAGIIYYFAMKVGDEVPNWSGISNVVSGQTNTQGNIAIGKIVSTSSVEGAGYEATKAIDGNPATRWSSQFSDPQWIKIDLADTYNITQVVLKWQDAYGKDYQIQVSSNNINWTTIYTKTNGTGGIETLGLNGSGRYIRMYGTARGTSWGYSLYEFEVYGTSGTTPTKSITITYPNGSENLIAGSQQTVTWTSAGGVGNVLIQISLDGGTNWNTLIPSTANDGSEVVTLPSSASSNCLIRLLEISGGTTDTSNSNFAITVTGQMSFGNNGNPWKIGVVISTIEAENYDTGGQGEAYNDTTPTNIPNKYRTNEGVDIEECTDIGGGYDVGYVVPTEWLEYSINVNETAEYQIIMRGAIDGIASPFHLEFGSHGGTAYRTTPLVSIPNTGGWQTWTDVEVSSNVVLTAGNQIMKLVLDTGAGEYNGNFNYIKIIRLSADTTPPVVSVATTTNISGNRAIITWTTNELANSKVEYGLTTGYGSATPVTDTGGVYSHSVPLTGLAENTLYHYRIVSVDMNGNTTTTGDYSFTTTKNDIDAPVITNVRASVTQNSAVITWNTDENSDTQVGYGTTTALGTTTTLDSTPARLHSVSITGLQKNKTYYYKVYSKDASDNLATSSQYSFKILSNIKHRIYTYYYDDGTTTTKIGASASVSLKFKLQVYNLDEGSLVTDYTGTVTLTTKNSKGSVLDTTDSTLTEADSGEKDVSIPFRSDINTVELTGDVTAPVVINFNDMYIAKLIGYQGGSIRGANGLRILIPTGVLSVNKYLASIKTSAAPAVQNTMRYVNTVNPICYDFGELTFNNNAPVLSNQTFIRALNITIPYTAVDIGTLDEDGLRIYYWTGTDWDLVTGVQIVDKTNNTVTATVTHFSTYRILGSYVTADMSNVRVYPNPYNPTTAVLCKLKVTNLPMNSVMKLYTVTGEKIRELKEIDFGNLGWLEWDGKNDDGDKVGRAVYIYQIEDTAGNKKTGKIGLIK
ncbi:MAG: DUF2961 domain-containing protein [Elusimicrobia bacterium]|nr:DUF2961 domain-containing protein [Elusimicrobiota bacterium]